MVPTWRRKRQNEAKGDQCQGSKLRYNVPGARIDLGDIQSYSFVLFLESCTTNLQKKLFCGIGSFELVAP